MVSRRRESAGVSSRVGGGLERRGDFFGEPVGDRGMEDEERERMMRDVWVMLAVEVVVVGVLSTFGFLRLAVVLRVLLLCSGLLPMSSVEASSFGSRRASRPLLDGLAGLLVDPSGVLFVRRNRFN